MSNEAKGTPRSKWAVKQKKIDKASDCTKMVISAIALAEFSPAPIKTSWGDGMMVADIALSKDATVSMYVHKDDIAKILLSA